MRTTPEVPRVIGVHVRTAGSPISHRNHHLEPLGSRAMLSAVFWGALLALHFVDRMITTSRAKLRQTLRARRKQLSVAQQRQAARQVDQIVTRQRMLKRNQSIAFYWPNDGEIDPSILLRNTARKGYHCYLPVLTTGNRLWFARYQPGDTLRTNRFGIPEPCTPRRYRKAWSLGLVFLPLVGFDRQGGRLGMGGGFYDRTFASTRLLPTMSHPKLMGLAHHCQEVPSLEMAPWDIPLAAVVTDKEMIRAALSPRQGSPE